MNRVAGIAAVFVIAAHQSPAQTIPTLPTPSGKYSVGATSFHLTGTQRPEPATENPGDHREILVRVWYPAAKPSPHPSPYLPGADRLASSDAANSLSNLFGPSWRAIAANQLKTHSSENAPAAPGARLPILLFSPGGGVPVAAYTAQMEELASNGYAIIGIDHTYESPAVVFPDGRVVTAAHEYLDRLRRENGDAESLEKKLTDMRAADLRFVIDTLPDLDSTPSSVLRARLDRNRIGAFGHSRGGRAVARACQLDDRIKACLNQDGNMAWRPFWLDENGRSLKQPFLMLDHFDPDPPDEVFRKMGTTREEYVARRSARQVEAREKFYETIAGGSYHVKIKTPGVSHNSFVDIRQLGRPDGSGINAWPEDVRAATPHARIMKAITAWTGAFFDSEVRGVPRPLAELLRAPGSEVEVRPFGRSSR